MPNANADLENNSLIFRAGGLFINIGNPAVAFYSNVTRSIQVEEASWPMAGANPSEPPGQQKKYVANSSHSGISHSSRTSPKRSRSLPCTYLGISTAKGLYALDAESGAQRWVYPTALPLGHSPTIQDGVAYVGGLDHKLNAIDAFTGVRRWAFEAGAGFEPIPWWWRARCMPETGMAFFMRCIRTDLRQVSWFLEVSDRGTNPVLCGL